jgi:hypothetical protein
MGRGCIYSALTFQIGGNDMRHIALGIFLTGMLAATGCRSPTPQPGSKGPSGGDVVSIKAETANGPAYAELLGNAETGEVMVHTWDKDLKTPAPIEKKPLIAGGYEKIRREFLLPRLIRDELRLMREVMQKTN